MSSKPRYYHIYCDESSHIQQRSFVVGGVMIRRDYLVEMAADFASFREAWKARAEFKWTKVSRSMLPAYKEIVDFAWRWRKAMRFGALVIDRENVLKSISRTGSLETVIEDQQIELVVNLFGNFLENEDGCEVIVDERQTAQQLTRVRTLSNYRLRKEKGVRKAPVREVRTVISHDSWEVQVADVLMGAVAFEQNGFMELTSASPAKIALVEYIREIRGVDRLVSEEARERDHFCILLAES